MQPTEDIMRTLIKAKGFLEHSKHHSLLGGEFDVMISIHNLDNSIEYMLRIIIRHLDIENLTGRTISTAELSGLIGEIQKFLTSNSSESLSYVQEIKKIRELRNMVQHAMILPVTELRTYLNFGQRFFENCLTKFFGITVDEIQFSTLVLDVDLKQMLVDIEKQIIGSYYLDAVANCRNAFEYAYFLFSMKSDQRIASAPLFAKLKNNDTDLYYYLNEVDTNLSISASGIDLTHYNRYKRYVRHLPIEYCTDWNGNSVLQRAWNKEDADFCYSFVSNAILSWEKLKIKPIHDFAPEEMYTSETLFNDIIIPDKYEGYSCVYFNRDYTTLDELLTVDGEIASLLKEKLQNGNTYLLGHKSYKNGKLESVFKKYALLNHHYIKLVVNFPAIWQVTINYTVIPFALHIVDGDIFDVDSLNKQGLSEMGVDDASANKILDFIDETNADEKLKKAFEVEKLVDSLGIESTYKISSSLIAFLESKV